MVPEHPVELDDLRRASSAGEHERALAIPLTAPLSDPDAEVVRVTYRAVSLEALGDPARAAAECDRALARLHDDAAVGRVEVCAAAIAERAGNADDAQARLGVAITAFGRAIRRNPGSTWLAQSRGWAMLERARLLRRVGRPAEGDRLESAGARALAAVGVHVEIAAPMAS